MNHTRWLSRRPTAKRSYQRSGVIAFHGIAARCLLNLPYSNQDTCATCSLWCRWAELQSQAKQHPDLMAETCQRDFEYSVQAGKFKVESRWKLFRPSVGFGATPGHKETNVSWR